MRPTLVGQLKWDELKNAWHCQNAKCKEKNIIFDVTGPSSFLIGGYFTFEIYFRECAFYTGFIFTVEELNLARTMWGGKCLDLLQLW